MKRAGRVGVGVVVGVGAVMMAVLVVHAVQESVRASRRQQCAGHLDRLGLAMHQYHAEHGHFPAPALAGRDGTPLLSWRVALLPHLGYRSLYEYLIEERAPP